MKHLFNTSFLILFVITAVLFVAAQNTTQPKALGGKAGAQKNAESYFEEGQL